MQICVKGMWVIEWRVLSNVERGETSSRTDVVDALVRREGTRGCGIERGMFQEGAIAITRG